MSNASAPHPQSTAAARRRPVQQRSHERRDRILTVAKHLIAQSGSERLTMSEIAAQAEVSIGSLYQYFPDKRAILRTLAEQYTAESRHCISEALSPATDPDTLAAAFSSLVDQYYTMFLRSPVRRDIIAGMRADHELMAIELAESRACGAILAAAVRRVYPQSDPKKNATLAFLIWQLGEDTMRLALAHKRSEGARLVDAYKKMSLQALVADC
jgi:AcrR family transcriptional regulator